VAGLINLYVAHELFYVVVGYFKPSSFLFEYHTKLIKHTKGGEKNRNRKRKKKKQRETIKVWMRS
jgi:hypothetical protein